MKASVERADVSRSIEVSSSLGRDYASLVDLLPQLSRVPDGLGETNLTEEEAEQIRALGFPADPGRWFAPLLPHDLVRDDGLLEPLSDSWAEDVDPRRLLTEQVEKSPARIDEKDSAVPGDGRDRILSEEQLRIFEALQRAGGWVKRRRLQKNLWRLGSRRFNEGLSSLQKSGVLELTGSMVRLTMTELDKELSANLQTPGNATLFQPVETVSVHRKDRRSERVTG